MNASAECRSRRAGGGVDLRLLSTCVKLEGGVVVLDLPLNGADCGLARAPLKLYRSRSEPRASSSQMKADRWLFPGPGVSHEVSMFIMVILIVVLTAALFWRIMSQRRIPSTSKSPEPSVTREHAADHFNACDVKSSSSPNECDPLWELLSQSGNTISYLLIINFT